MNYTEQQRLDAVNRFKKLDAEIIRDLNDIVTLVAEICETPVALVTLIDEDVQWFKAATGTKIDCTERGISFCNQTIKQAGITTIPDMTADAQHCTNPLVVKDPNVRFYAGATLITKDGFAIGSLCVLDIVPRELTAHQQKTLLLMAKQVVNLMEFNFSLNSLAHQHIKEQEQIIAIRESELRLKAVFDSSNDSQVLVDKNFEVLAFNRAAADDIRSVYRHRLANGNCILNYIDKAILDQFKKYFNVALSGKSIKREWLLMQGTAFAACKITTFIPVKNSMGKVIGVALNSTDITHHKKQEAYINIQNEALHRIAIIQSHELRRPVASLLGIIDLIKIEEVDFRYRNIMEETVNELDEKIRGIVKESEDTLHGRHLAVVA
jgi:PAS domain S-box-containing protein